MLSNGNAGLVQLNMSNVNGAAKNKLHEKWDTVKRKLGPLVKKSTSSPGKYFKSLKNTIDVLVTNPQNDINGSVNNTRFLSVPTWLPSDGS